MNIHTRSLMRTKRTHACPIALSNNPKNATQDTQKSLPILPKTIPSDNPIAKERSDTVRRTRNQFLAPGFPIMHPKISQNQCPKDDKTLQNHECISPAKEDEFWLQFEASKKAFRKPNSPLWNTFRKTYAKMNSPLIFKGYTVRFACFYNRRTWDFAP